MNVRYMHPKCIQNVRPSCAKLVEIWTIKDESKKNTFCRYNFLPPYLFSNLNTSMDREKYPLSVDVMMHVNSNFCAKTIASSVFLILLFFRVLVVSVRFNRKVAKERDVGH